MGTTKIDPKTGKPFTGISPRVARRAAGVEKREARMAGSAEFYGHRHVDREELVENPDKKYMLPG